ncbi:MAG TPA: 8-oxoguanine DNA glycosylase [Clostridiaceae bacterium]|nr:8-oxoguanine DNA glycosylase [Clostridiaceae bacterium]
MNYKGYEIKEQEGKVIVNNVRDFNPVHIFECGQCFRWIRQEDGSYTGVVKDKAAVVRYMNGKLEISNSAIEDLKNIWFDYFDLGRDYSEIKRRLSKDEIMKKAIEFGYGIRLLKQDLWETLISFIISANNRIPMIMKVVGAISEMYGSEIIMDGKSYYTFPDVDKLAGSALEQLEMCRGGFRCKYILKTAQMVKDGTVNLASLANMTTDEAREELKRFPGVGNKVADCTILYSGTKYDVFPTDVWVKRVMEELYFGRPATFSEIQNFAADYFGELAGFAQQYLFYYAREHKIGTGK